ncbi:hypothetical protein IW150_006248 [Coemansia sp. RSA 2607]|nr:hypothetical protein IW150_006248 [Coemansia sp. RSA 2607]
MDSLQAQPTARKITAISWLPPAAGTSYSDATPRFIAGTSGKTKELVLWTTHNPDFPSPSTENSTDLAHFVSKTPHTHSVQAIAAVSAELLLTGSSTGVLATYKIIGDAMERGAEVQVHGERGAEAVCTGVAVQSDGTQVASCGEDGRLVFATVDRLDAPQSISADSGSLTSLCWPTPTQVAVATRNGQAKLFDTRESQPSAVFYNPSSCASLESIAAHPSQPFLLATGSDDGAVVLWDVRNPRAPKNELFGVHRANVWQVMFDPADARSIVSCSEDASVAVTRWDEMGVHRTKRMDSRLNVLSINCFDICPYTRDHMLVAGSDSGNLLVAKTGVKW